MTKQEWVQYLLENGKVRVLNKRDNKGIVEFQNYFYLFKDDAVIDRYIYLATAKRNYKLV